mmetsp:Transcript_618/g.2180  ORF Transcript_618/g.2180 Transcript_618/m.2180 type:complete len:407 (-) Transcript_618:52-1272(-)
MVKGKGKGGKSRRRPAGAGRGGQASEPPPDPPTAEEVAALEEQGFLVIDGSFGEGGGQIMRYSFALACLLQRPIFVQKIRANRSKPGLKSQHLCGIKMVAALHNKGDSMKLTGAVLRGNWLVFEPAPFSAIEGYVADIGTAGATCLLVQVSMPALLFSAKEFQLELKGGTNAIMAPQIDYFTDVFMPIAGKMGVQATIDVVTRGYYPKGGGHVRYSVPPVKELQPIELLDQGTVTHIRIRAFVSQLPVRIAENMSSAAERTIREALDHEDGGIAFAIENVQEEMSFGFGSGIIIIATTSTGCILAGSGLGGPKQRDEEVGKAAANELLQDIWSGGCVDQYLQDQLIIFMALADGVSRIRAGPLTLHTTTGIHMTSMFTGAEFKTTTDGGTTVIECKGVGFKNQYIA